MMRRLDRSRVTTFFATLIASCSAAFCSGCAGDDDAPKDVSPDTQSLSELKHADNEPTRQLVKQIAGRWYFLKTVWADQETPADRHTAASYEFLDHGTMWFGLAYHDESGNVEDTHRGTKAKYSIDASHSPAQITVDIETGTRPMHHEGIVKVEDEMLYLVLGMPNEPRPTDFQLNENYALKVYARKPPHAHESTAGQ